MKGFNGALFSSVEFLARRSVGALERQRVARKPKSTQPLPEWPPFRHHEVQTDCLLLVHLLPRRHDVISIATNISTRTRTRKSASISKRISQGKRTNNIMQQQQKRKGNKQIIIIISNRRRRRRKK